jgi:rsbT co-antagonist protein RsbR
VNEVNAGTKVDELHARIAELEQQLADQREVIRALMDANPDGVAIATLTGALTFNPAAEAILGTSATSTGTDTWSDHYGLFLPDTKTPYPPEQLPLARAIGGEQVDDGLIFSRGPDQPDGTWLLVSARPLYDGNGAPRGAVANFRDVTERMQLERDLAARNRELQASEHKKTELINQLRAAIGELSTPVLALWDGVLALPIIGVIDEQRSVEMTSRLLDEVARSRAAAVIIDLTGVEAVDTAIAERLSNLVRSVELLGARCYLTGLQPAVAQTLVALDVDFGRLRMLRNLELALRDWMATAR